MAQDVFEIMKLVGMYADVDDANYEKLVYEKIDSITSEMAPDEKTIFKLCLTNMNVNIGQAVKEVNAHLDSVIEQGEIIVNLAKEGRIDISGYGDIEIIIANIKNNKDILVVDAVNSKKVTMFSESFKGMVNAKHKQMCGKLFGIDPDDVNQQYTVNPECKTLADYYNKFESLYCARYGVSQDTTAGLSSTYTLTIDHSKPISDIKADIAKFAKEVEVNALMLDYYMVLDKLKADTRHAAVDSKGRNIDVTLFRTYDRCIRVYELIEAEGGIDAIKPAKLDAVGKLMQNKYGEYNTKAYINKPSQVRARLRDDYHEALKLIDKAGKGTSYN